MGSTDARKFIQDMRARLDAARARVKAAQAQRVILYGRSVSKLVVRAGDWVFVKNRDRKVKLDPLWVGPFKVTKVQGKVVSIERAGRKLAKVNMSVCRLPQRVEHTNSRIVELRTAKHRDPTERDVWALEGRNDAGAWTPISVVYDQDVAGWSLAWVSLSNLIDSDAARSSHLLWRRDALGTKVLRKYGGKTIVLEFDGPACKRGEASYRIIHADGDDEDIGEGEFERARQAYLQFRQSV